MNDPTEQVFGYAMSEVRSRNKSLTAGLAAFAAMATLFFLNSTSNELKWMVAAIVGVLLLLYAAAFTAAHRSWLLCALVLQEVLPYVNILPVDPATRWVLRLPLVALFCLPVVPRALKSGLLWKGNFRLYVLYFGWSALSVAYSLAPGTSAGRLFPAMLVALALCSIAADVDSADDVRCLLSRFLIACGIILVLILISAFAFPSDRTWLVEGTISRFSGIFSAPNELGGLMVVSVGVGLALWPTASGRGKTGILMTIVLAILFAAMADSRTAFISLAAGLGSYLVWRKGIRGLVLLGAGMVAIGALATLLDSDLRDRYFGRDLDTLTGRTEAWDFAVDKVLERPLLGYGFEVEGEIFHNRYFHNWEAFWDRGVDAPLHSGFLSIAVGGGVLALLFWCFLFARPWIAIFRNDEDPWKLKPIAFLCVVPLVVYAFDESWIGDCRYPKGLLLFICWALAERQRLTLCAEASSSVVSRSSGLVLHDVSAQT